MARITIAQLQAENARLIEHGRALRAKYVALQAAQAAPATRSIACGHCKKRHNTVADVRACAGV